MQNNQNFIIFIAVTIFSFCLLLSIYANKKRLEGYFWQDISKKELQEAIKLQKDFVREIPQIVSETYLK